MKGCLLGGSSRGVGVPSPLLDDAIAGKNDQTGVLRMLDRSDDLSVAGQLRDERRVMQNVDPAAVREDDDRKAAR